MYYYFSFVLFHLHTYRYRYYLNLTLPSIFTSKLKKKYTLLRHKTRWNGPKAIDRPRFLWQLTIPYRNVIFPHAWFTYRSYYQVFLFFFWLRFFDLLSSISFLLFPPLCPRSLLRTIVAQCHAAKSGVPPVVSSCTSQNSPLGSDRRDRMYAARKKKKTRIEM